MPIIEFPSRKLNKKKLIICIILCVILVAIVVCGIIYYFNSAFRRFFDIYIFRKEIASEDLSYIEINSTEDNFFHAYDKYIASLNKNILYIYNSSAQVVNKNDINISSPIFASNNKFLVIAENNGSDIYFVSGINVVWQNTLDGNISKVSVNKNGYTSVIISGTSYKSIIILFNPKGEELFRTYLSNNIAIATDISNDNKFLSIAEIDYSGSIVKSSIKNISIEKAKSDPTNSVIYTFNLPDNILLTNIKFQDKNSIICQANNMIYLLNISDFSNTELLPINNTYDFIDINLKNSYVYSTNENHGFSNTAIINISNLSSSNSCQYSFSGSIKEIYSKNDKIAVNTGIDVHFLTLNGWLIKKYTSYSEVNNIIIGDSIAGIIYKDKVKIINL